MKKYVYLSILTIVLFFVGYSVCRGEEWNGANWDRYKVDHDPEPTCIMTWWDEPNLTTHCVRWVVMDETNCLFNYYGYGEDE